MQLSEQFEYIPQQNFNYIYEADGDATDDIKAELDKKLTPEATNAEWELYCKHNKIDKDDKLKFLSWKEERATTIKNIKDDLSKPVDERKYKIGDYDFTRSTTKYEKPNNADTEKILSQLNKTRENALKELDDAAKAREDARKNRDERFNKKLEAYNSSFGKIVPGFIDGPVIGVISFFHNVKNFIDVCREKEYDEDDISRKMDEINARNKIMLRAAGITDYDDLLDANFSSAYKSSKPDNSLMGKLKGMFNMGDDIDAADELCNAALTNKAFSGAYDALQKDGSLDKLSTSLRQLPQKTVTELDKELTEEQKEAKRLKDEENKKKIAAQKIKKKTELLKKYLDEHNGELPENMDEWTKENVDSVSDDDYLAQAEKEEKKTRKQKNKQEKKKTGRGGKLAKKERDEELDAEAKEKYEEINGEGAWDELDDAGKDEFIEKADVGYDVDNDDDEETDKKTDIKGPDDKTYHFWQGKRGGWHYFITPGGSKEKSNGVSKKDMARMKKDLKSGKTPKTTNESKSLCTLSRFILEGSHKPKTNNLVSYINKRLR